jgi:hypothetical protein
LVHLVQIVQLSGHIRSPGRWRGRGLGLRCLLLLLRCLLLLCSVLSGLHAD